MVQFFPKPFDPSIFNGILESSVATIGTIAIVALDFYDFLGQLKHLVGSTKANNIGNSRVCGILAVSHSETTTDKYVVTYNLSILDNGNETQVV